MPRKNEKARPERDAKTDRSRAVRRKATAAAPTRELDEELERQRRPLKH